MRIRPLITSLFPSVALDLGSTTVRVWASGAAEPAALRSLVAGDARNHLVAVGQPALELFERTPKQLTIVRPIERGVIKDEPAAKLLIQSALGLQQAYLRWRVPPIMMATIPVAATKVQQDRVRRVLDSIGARESYLIAQPLAAAIGAGIPLGETAGSVLLQLGGGVAEAAALTLGGITAAASSDFAGASLVEQIRLGLREQYVLDVSQQMAAEMLQMIVLSPDVTQPLRVTGKHITSSEPKNIKIDGSVLVPGLLLVADRYVTLVRDVLRQVPPAVTGDVLERGILLSGGVAKLKGLDAYLTAQLQLPCSVIEQPETAVVRGIRRALEQLPEFKSLQEN